MAKIKEMFKLASNGNGNGWASRIIVWVAVLFGVGVTVTAWLHSDQKSWACEQHADIEEKCKMRSKALEEKFGAYHSDVMKLFQKIDQKLEEKKNGK